ncbi:MAG: DUF3160 domain-containing protein [Myxococcales bacterium]
MLLREISSSTRGRLLALALASSGCHSDSAGSVVDSGLPDGSTQRDGSDQDPADTPTPVEVAPNAKAKAKFDALAAQLAEAERITRADFDQRYRVADEPLSFDPMSAANLDQIQKSFFELNAQELFALEKYGVVIQKRHNFPHFTAGLQHIYMEDLPVYVSADSILDALHISYDGMLESLELSALSPTLFKLLSRLINQLEHSSNNLGDSREDLDVYLGVARALLTGNPYPTLVAGGDEELAGELVQAAMDADGIQNFQLFGVKRSEDFSQFKPRGHYEGNLDLERYFRAMVWLGRIDFRLLETQSDGSVVFRRRQFDATLALYQLFDAGSLAAFGAIDGALQEFVGESDYMVLSQVPDLLAALKVQKPEDTTALADADIAEAIAQSGLGDQRIASHFMVSDGTVGMLPLNRSFALLGQRYIVDSHVFSKLVHDRVPGRMMPNPLDVAFAALDNDRAAQLLGSELDQYGYQGALHATRITVDALEPDFWQENLYNSWLTALRALSPAAAPEGLPAPMKSDGWGRRMVNSQLGSWAELRHDTVLYAKQSYTLGAVCEFPEAYVDPYPQFFAAIIAYCDRALDMTDRLEGFVEPSLLDSMRDYFGTMRSSLVTLKTMAEQQLAGTPFTLEQLAFINDAVRIQPTEPHGCGPSDPVYLGWYPRMLWKTPKDFDPTIADVHTQPTDLAGNLVGRVLHVGTGAPRSMVVTVNTCQGPRAYVGLVFAYHEVIKDDFQRLTDEEWSASYFTEKPADVPWMSLVVP